MSPALIGAVALGGALGALARYGLAGAVGWWLGPGFPLGTLVVNVVGCFAMGVLVETAGLVWSPGPVLRTFLAIGFLGAFTTFSSFSLDVAVLAERGALPAAFLYVAASVVLSIAGLFAGLWLVRTVAP